MRELFENQGHRAIWPIIDEIILNIVNNNSCIITQFALSFNYYSI